MNCQVSQRRAEHIDNKARSGLAITEACRTVVRDHLDQVVTHLKLHCLDLTRVLLHPERNKVEHSLIFED